jgi:hypothetical protein
MNYSVKIVLTTEDLNNLHYLTEREGVNRNTIIRASLTLNKYIQQQVSQGNKILLLKENGKFLELEFKNLGKPKEKYHKEKNLFRIILNRFFRR